MGDQRDPRRVSFHDLPGGARLVVQPAPAGGASFAASYLGPAGSGFDPRGREGLAEMTSEALRAGTTASTRAHLFRRIDRLGGTLTVSTDPEVVHLQLTGPAEEHRRLLELMAEVLQSPRFEPGEVERIRRELAEAQLRERHIASLRADVELLQWLFPAGHPYRASGSGTARSLARIRPSDLRSFHRRQYSGRSAAVVVTHPGPTRAIVRTASELFEYWPADRPPVPPKLPALRPLPAGPRRVHLPGQSQVEIRIGAASPPRSSPLYPACELADQLLGGRPVLSRLFQVIREREGLAYHASSHLTALSWGGYWELQAGTAPRHATKVLRLLESEVERLSREPPSDEELRRIRESAIGEIPLGLETAATAHDWAVEIARFGLPETHLIDWPDRVREVSASDLREAWQKGFVGAPRAAVLAGPIP
ncbi:MAG: M16 family metallopeptidase [Thermoplasmata archaeon]